MDEFSHTAHRTLHSYRSLIGATALRFVGYRGAGRQIATTTGPRCLATTRRAYGRFCGFYGGFQLLEVYPRRTNCRTISRHTKVNRLGSMVIGRSLVTSSLTMPEKSAITSPDMACQNVTQQRNGEGSSTGSGDRA